jgi:hypothetical protein
VVLAVAGHAAVEADAVRQNVNVFMLGVVVPGDDWFKARIPSMAFAPISAPLLVCELSPGAADMETVQNDVLGWA